MKAMETLNYKSLLSILCPLITLIPVLNFVWMVPAEAPLTLGAWVICNLLVQGVLWSIAHMERTSLRRATN
jgi:hypothetical protein